MYGAYNVKLVTVEFSLCPIWRTDYFEFEIIVAETEDEFLTVRYISKFDFQ